jgi:hypothetical protein
MNAVLVLNVFLIFYGFLYGMWQSEIVAITLSLCFHLALRVVLFCRMQRDFYEKPKVHLNHPPVPTRDLT